MISLFGTEASRLRWRFCALSCSRNWLDVGHVVLITF